MKTYTVKLRKSMYSDESPDIKDRRSDIIISIYSMETAVNWIREHYLGKECRFTGQNTTSKGILVNKSGKLCIELTETRSVDGEDIQLTYVSEEILDNSIIIYD